MTAERPLRALALAACALLTLTGCPSPGQAADDKAAAAASAAAASVRPALPTNASTGLPAYQGPPPGGLPGSGPPTRLIAAVDLTYASPGAFSSVRSAVAAPGGGAYVVLSPEITSFPEKLGTVSKGASGWAVTGSVPIPLEDVWGMHLLADGGVAVVGPLRAGDAQGGYGVVVVAPGTGAVRTIRAVAPRRGPVLAFGRSALSPDRRTLYLFVSTLGRGSAQERLLALDLASGHVLAERDLADDVAAASSSPAGHDVAGLVPRPDGGATLVFDATPDATRPERIPTLLTYDGALARIGQPVRVTSLAEGAETKAVAGGTDGTVFLSVEVPGAAWILAVPDRGGAGPVLVQLDDSYYDYSLVVDPAQKWALLPAPQGARAVDLTTGKEHAPVDVGCPGRDVRAVFSGAGGSDALLVGVCNAPRTRTQMLWILGH
jgi:hypothetical protein